MKKTFQLLIMGACLMASIQTSYGQDNISRVGDLLISKEWVLYKKTSAQGDDFEMAGLQKIVLLFQKNGTGKCLEVLPKGEPAKGFEFNWYLSISQDNEPRLIIKNRANETSKNADNFIFSEFFKDKVFNLRVLPNKEQKAGLYSRGTKESYSKGIRYENQLRFTPLNENKEITLHYYLY